ncbi:MAG: hypothetical protein DHS20C15_23370 [Planctomycetota bacterium]|nr:MAG: hypothetical protein DHS20C15_23370 [Planctomycetota bacterium]
MTDRVAPNSTQVDLATTHGARARGPTRRTLLAASLAALLVACMAPEEKRGFITPARSNQGDGVAPLVVTSDLDNLPFAGVDENGKPIGRDVEMMEALAAALGRPVEWKRSPFETLLPAAHGGFVDVVCATLGITPERKQKVAFTRPYFKTVIHVVVRAGEGEARGWSDLYGRPVAASIDTTSERAVRQILPGATLVLENKEALGAAERLLLGEVDGVAMDGPAAEKVVRESGGALTLIEPPLTSEHYALALPKDRVQLLAELNALLARFEANGQLDAWNRRWGLAR